MRWPRQLSVLTIQTVERSGSLLPHLARSGSKPNPPQCFVRPPAGRARASPAGAEVESSRAGLSRSLHLRRSGCHSAAPSRW